MIKNITKKKTLVEKTEMADSMGKKTRGLMFRKNLGPESGFLMVFRYDGRHSIWMPFMRFGIDIVYIDKEKRIVDIRHSVRPIGKNPMTWRVYKPKEKCRYVLEVASGLVKKSGTETGDVLEF